MNQWKVIIPTMIMVAILATWMLEKYHSEVPVQWRILIIGGGTLLSGLITFYMSYLDRKRENTN